MQICGSRRTNCSLRNEARKSIDPSGRVAFVETNLPRRINSHVLKDVFLQNFPETCPRPIILCVRSLRFCPCYKSLQHVPSCSGKTPSVLMYPLWQRLPFLLNPNDRSQYNPVCVIRSFLKFYFNKYYVYTWISNIMITQRSVAFLTEHLTHCIDRLRCHQLTWKERNQLTNTQNKLNCVQKLDQISNFPDTGQRC